MFSYIHIDINEKNEKETYNNLFLVLLLPYLPTLSILKYVTTENN